MRVEMKQEPKLHRTLWDMKDIGFYFASDGKPFEE
jgi:hypothetical protein